MSALEPSEPRGTRTHRPSTRRRRAALLQAAVELAGESGAGAVTHRAVAARAGLPPATTSYFFGSIGELLAAALRTYGEERAAELNQLAEELTAQVAPEEAADRFAELILRRERTVELAEVESYLYAAREPELRAAITELSAAYERVAVAALRAAGAGHPEEWAPAFKALSDGFVLSHLAAPRPDDRARLASAFRALFAGFTAQNSSSGTSSSSGGS